MRERPSLRSAVRGPLGLFVVALLLTGGLLSLSAPASATANPAFKVTISGPSILPINGTGAYIALAQGGPAEALNGSFVGNYTFTDQIVGVDTTGSFVSPVSGAFIGEQLNLTLGGLNSTGVYTLELNVTSHGPGGRNETQVFSYAFTIVIPFLIQVTVQNLNAYTLSSAVIDVSLDGNPVGVMSVPSLSPSGTTVLKYNYTAPLLPGYHTFTLTLVGAVGLLEFSNGQRTISVQFYVQGSPPSYTNDYIFGAGLTVLAILISILFFGPRRASRKKKSP